MSARNHAVVIGGSIAGLWAARVLADHFERVTVIDRDHFPTLPEARRGVPQGRQVHVLLVRGQQILDQLFPGLSAELEAGGVTTIRWTEDTYSYGTHGRWSEPFPYGYRTLGCSRILLEWHMHQRLSQNPKITFVEGRQVTGLILDETNSRAIGVRTAATGAERAISGEEAITADLIVDASGRESKAPDWLTALGYPAPEEIAIDSHVGYATRFYQRPANFNARWKSVLIQSRDGTISRSGLIYPIENDQWMALLVGVNLQLPDDDASYLEFARLLPQSDFYDAIKDAEPLSPVYRYLRTGNQLRRYDQLERFPESFVILGDAACAFNPVFGQGMTVSAMEALLLDEHLRQPDAPGFSLRFQQAVAKLIASPWQLATSEDARNKSAGESVSLRTRFLRTYLDHLLGMVGTNPTVGRAFLDVQHLLQPPTVLFQPRVAAYVFRSMLTNRHPLQPPTSQT